VFTNAPPTDAYRGAGKPESAATLERLLDLAAQRLGMDPLEFRRRNLLKPEKLPYATAMGETYDGGNFPLLAENQDSGQGHFEALARVASESLDVPLEQVIVEQGDSDVLSIGGGTGGSCLMPIAANTLHRAALQLIEDNKENAAERLEASVADIVYGEGAFQVVGTDRQVTWGDLAAGDEEEPKVSVDRFIGVSDVGKVMSYHGVMGQIHGGIAQGLGEVVMEELVHSPDGQLLTGSLMDYALPRADDLPDLKMELFQTPSPNSALGVKGVGELSSIGAPGVIMNAIIDAAGVRHIDKPLTPARIWQAMQDEAG